MGWIQNIQQKPKEERIRIIWIFVIIAAVLLIILWIVTWGYKKSAPKDTTLFNAISTSVHNVQVRFTPIKK